MPYAVPNSEITWFVACFKVYYKYLLTRTNLKKLFLIFSDVPCLIPCEKLQGAEQNRVQVFGMFLTVREEID